MYTREDVLDKVRTFIDTKQRRPKLVDFCPAQGLINRTTVWKLFGHARINDIIAEACGTMTYHDMVVDFFGRQTAKSLTFSTRDISDTPGGRRGVSRELSRIINDGETIEGYLVTRHTDAPRDGATRFRGFRNV